MLGIFETALPTFFATYLQFTSQVSPYLQDAKCFFNAMKTGVKNFGLSFLRVGKSGDELDVSHGIIIMTQYCIDYNDDFCFQFL